MLKSIKMWTGLSSDDYGGAETQEGTADQGWSWWVQREQAAVSRSQREELQDRIERRMQRIKNLVVLIRSWPTLPTPPLAFPGGVGVEEVQTFPVPMRTPRVRPARTQPAAACCVLF